MRLEARGSRLGWLALAVIGGLACAGDVEARRKKPSRKPAAKSRPTKAKPSPPPSPSPATPPPSPATPSPSPTSSLQPPAWRRLEDPLLGVSFELPPDYRPIPARTPVNLIAKPPATPPFTTNVSIAIDHDATPLASYTATLARRSGSDPFSGAPARTVAGKPAVTAMKTFSHQDLKLASLQTLVDASPLKVVVTTTALEANLAAAQAMTTRLLDSLKLGRRTPLPIAPGTPYRDADNRFALVLPPRFSVDRNNRGPQLAQFLGPIEKGVPLLGVVDDVSIPQGWAATDDRLSVMRRGIPGDRTARWLLDGTVLKRPGRPDALLLKLRDYPGELEMLEVALEQVVNGRLYRAYYRGTALGFELYEAALRASLESFSAPAPK